MNLFPTLAIPLLPLLLPLLLHGLLLPSISAASETSHSRVCVPPSNTRVCRPGTYDNGNLCAPCPPGTITKTRGAFFCTACPLGTASSSDRTNCIKCPPGSRVLNRACVSCPSGTYTSGLHTFTPCTSCPSNHTTRDPYRGGTSPSDCFACGKGQYLSVGGFVNRCRSCFAGQYQDEEGHAECKACPPGYGDANTGRDVYLPSRVSDCDRCPPGTYSKLSVSRDGSFRYRTCTKCPVGTYAHRFAIGDRCVSCPAGSRSTLDRTRCVPKCNLATQSCRNTACAPGTQPKVPLVRVQRPALSSLTCMRCPWGTVNSRRSTTPCTACPPPLVSSWNRRRCICKGKQQVLGLYTPGRCDPCPFPSVRKNATSCVCRGDGQLFDGFSCRCVKPLHKAVRGKCVPCSADEVNRDRTSRNVVNQNKCNLCKEGEFLSPKTGLCETCPEGFTNYGQNNKRNCERCRESYKTSKGRTVCGCRPGHRLIRDGVCRACPAGTALLYGPFRECVDCGYEDYSDVAGLSMCKKCPVGQRYSYNDRQTTCPPTCPAHATAYGGRCVCDPGYINAGSRSHVKCRPCPGGAHLQVRSGGDDSRKCVCVDGYGRDGRTGRCVQCGRGSYGRGGVCRKCGVNEITTERGQTSCTRCESRSYSICEGGTTCTKCRDGWFVDRFRRCRRCSPGFKVRGGRCVRCGQNEVSRGGTVSVCTKCKNGKKAAADRKTCV